MNTMRIVSVPIVDSICAVMSCWGQRWYAISLTIIRVRTNSRKSLLFWSGLKAVCNCLLVKIFQLLIKVTPELQMTICSEPISTVKQCVGQIYFHDIVVVHLTKFILECGVEVISDCLYLISLWPEQHFHIDNFRLTWHGGTSFNSPQTVFPCSDGPVIFSNQP